jgi:hypothetical protein
MLTPESELVETATVDHFEAIDLPLIGQRTPSDVDMVAAGPAVTT